MGRKQNRRRLPNHQGLQHRNQVVAEADSQGTVPRRLGRRADGVLASEPGGRNRYLVLAVCGFLLLAVGLVFGQTIRHEFVGFDDDRYVYDNPQVSCGLSAEGICWAFTHSHVTNWHPLTWISLMLDCQLYGLSPGGYHLTNVLLHATTAVFLFLVLRAMTGRLWPSALAAALFAVHPLRVESVAWVTERKDVLSGLFFVLTLWAYLGYVRHRFSLLRYLAVMMVFSLGLMAKPMLVTLPLVLLLLDYWPLRRMSDSPRLDPTLPQGDGGTFARGATFPKADLGRFSFPWRLVLEKVPWLALVLISCVLTVWAQHEALVSIERLPLWWRLGNALTSCLAYVGQFFYPAGLAVYYPHMGLELAIGKVIAAVLVLLGITGAALVCRRRCPYWFVGWFWYLVMLVPVIGLVQVGAQTMADRYTYLPQIGLCMALVWGGADVCQSWPYRRGAFGIASALLLAILLGCAWRQTSFWCDNETLWTHTLACTMGNSVAHYNMGVDLAHQGRLDEAMAHYQKTLEIKPDSAEAHNNLGAVFARLDRIDEAMAHYQKALEIKPDYAEAHYNLGAAFARLDRFDEAMAQYQKALEIEPAYAEAHYNLGNALANRGRIDEAMAQYRKALEIKPDYVEALNNLGTAFARLGRFDEAIARYRKVVEIRPGLAEVHYDLGYALANRGRIDEAVAHYRKALDLATQHNNQALADALRAKIAQYEVGKPYHKPPSVSAPAKP